MATTIEELLQAGLYDDGSEHLTEKGRDWLQALADLQAHDAVVREDAAADLILSTSGLIR